MSSLKIVLFKATASITFIFSDPFNVIGYVGSPLLLKTYSGGEQTIYDGISAPFLGSNGGL